LIINPKQKKVDYLVIDDGKWYTGAKLLPYSKVLNIGRDAITIETQKDIRPFAEVEGAEELAAMLEVNSNARVFTRRGRYMGKIVEYLFEEKEGKIVGCLLGDGGQGMIPCEKVITFGRDIVIVSEEEEGLLQTAEEKTVPDRDSEIYQRPEKQTMESSISQMAEDADSIAEESREFEQRQRQFLIGRKAGIDIMDEHGERLVQEGQEITDEIVEKVKAHGKLVELIMNAML